MTSIAALNIIYADNLIKTADIVAAASVDALRGTDIAFRKDIQEIRNQEGQKVSASNLRRLLRGSQIRKSHKHCGRVQDAYSIRCIPQVHGAVRDCFQYASKIIENEMNSTTDNPLVFLNSKEVISGGNFHGETIAIPIDALKIAISEIASISERRTYRLIDHHETGLSPFITPDAGLNSGFMMLQVTAASLVSENKILSHPASVDSIPTSLGQEDHVSMGTIGARKLAEVVQNSADVLSIELFASMNAINMRKPLKSSKPISELYREFSAVIKPVTRDRAFYRDLEIIRKMVLNGDIVKIIQKNININ